MHCPAQSASPGKCSARSVLSGNPSGHNRPLRKRQHRDVIQRQSFPFAIALGTRLLIEGFGPDHRPDWLLLERAYIDTLTEIPNRRSFMTRKTSRHWPGSFVG